MKSYKWVKDREKDNNVKSRKEKSFEKKWGG